MNCSVRVIQYFKFVLVFCDISLGTSYEENPNGTFDECPSPNELRPKTCKDHYKEQWFYKLCFQTIIERGIKFIWLFMFIICLINKISDFIGLVFLILATGYYFKVLIVRKQNV